MTQFIDIVLEEHSYNNNKHVMFMMGQDFAYMAAHITYKNLDKLIKNANKHTNETGVHLLYSTPMCYLEALSRNQESGWTTVETDFFPYQNSELI